MLMMCKGELGSTGGATSYMGWMGGVASTAP